MIRPTPDWTSTSIMRGFSKTKIPCMNLEPGLVKTFNQMHVGYRVRVEWGIGGLEMKWRRLQKLFDLVKTKFAITFRVAALLKNFLHRRRNMRAIIEN